MIFPSLFEIDDGSSRSPLKMFIYPQVGNNDLGGRSWGAHAQRISLTNVYL